MLTVHPIPQTNKGGREEHNIQSQSIMNATTKSKTSYNLTKFLWKQDHIVIIPEKLTTACNNLMRFQCRLECIVRWKDIFCQSRRNWLAGNYKFQITSGNQQKVISCLLHVSSYVVLMWFSLDNSFLWVYNINTPKWLSVSFILVGIQALFARNITLGIYCL